LRAFNRGKFIFLFFNNITNSIKKNLKTILVLSTLIFSLLINVSNSSAASLASTLKSKILLQVEQNGEAWYVNPSNEKRYFLGRPADAFNVMRELGLGISNKDFDSFNGYAPSRLSGKILLKVEDGGKAYYVNTNDLKMHYLGRPSDAFRVMRESGLGITDANLELITSFDSETTETPVVDKNVTSQPAYLITAYSKNGKNYIDVDYIESLHGEASIKAQVEDGKCASTKDCYDYPNGYKRNQNPKIRTFEVSRSASINVSGNIAFELNALGQNLSISFEKLESVVSKLKSYLPYNPPFKEPRAFIIIDVKDNIVTKIVEPYQE